VDDAFARHFVDKRDSLLERRFGGGQIVTVNGGADVLQRAPETRSELAIVLAVL